MFNIVSSVSKSTLETYTIGQVNWFSMRDLCYSDHLITWPTVNHCHAGS